ncbi:unnamed protein product [Effrenium voratum]|uniref:Uncharacterized protein n=1 Tax=Effrenium voratum TaxID=2562239 RepID=A0AA36I6K3_9DINO|nr:unnamed protein product [Effrenium voratum]
MTPETATGWLSDIQTRIKQDLMKKVAEMIEVNIANFHVRFEDLPKVRHDCTASCPGLGDAASALCLRL